jgi:hypothetical protein
MRLPAAGGRAPDAKQRARDEKPPQGKSGEVNALREADRVIANRFGPPGVVVDSGLRIVQSRGAIEPYLRLGAGRPSLEVLKSEGPTETAPAAGLNRMSLRWRRLPRTTARTVHAHSAFGLSERCGQRCQALPRIATPIIMEPTSQQPRLYVSESLSISLSNLRSPLFGQQLEEVSLVKVIAERRSQDKDDA